MYYLEFVDLEEDEDVLKEIYIDKKVYEDKESKVFLLNTTLDTWEERKGLLALLEKYKDYKPSFTKLQEEINGED